MNDDNFSETQNWKHFCFDLRCYFHPYIYSRICITNKTRKKEDKVYNLHFIMYIHLMKL